MSPVHPGTFSIRWTIIGAVAGVGAWWFYVWLMIGSRFETEAAPYIAHAAAAATIGSLMMRFQPLRPTREPVAAAVLAIGLMTLVFIVIPHWFTWVADRSPRPWLVVPAIAALSAASAFGGGLASRRTQVTTPHLVPILLLSAFLTLGLLTVLSNVLLGFTGSFDFVALWYVVSPLSVLVAGYLTQLVTPIYRPWACGAGWFFAFGMVMKQRWSAAPGVELIDAPLLAVTTIALLLGAAGARAARGRIDTTGITAVPVARID
ncbi:MAG: hypothetical protein AB7O24_09480 [Kofleriaceae bacterium]